jgi:hypothetical protein
MAVPTDRGHVILSEDANGRTTVLIGTTLTDGAVRDVYARHAGVVSVKVHDGVRLATGPHGRHTVDAVEVYVDTTGTVNIARAEPTGDLRAQFG